MTIGLVGRKCGMIRIFDADGVSIPVSVIEVTPNRITQVKTNEKDGYSAIQITIGQCRKNRITKPLAGHFAKANVEAGKGLWEFRLEDGSNSEALTEEGKLKIGAELTLDLFKEGQYVDVSGVTKGKGFAGVIKRYHFSCQDATHGNSLSHRAPGSIGQNQSPGHVFKGKKMAGHLGNKKRTIQSLKIIKVDHERNLLLIQGGIPGAPGGVIIILPAIKRNSAKGE